ncbi:MAG: hypothetical protein ACREQ5_17105 [Candidatus Dormibacteria bacterium]
MPKDTTRGGRGIKWLTVRTLDRLCQMVDEVAYRPAVVKTTLRLPRWWRCDLARLSVWLDNRWDTGRWRDGGRPDSLCRACGRRAAWLDIFWEEEGVTDDRHDQLEKPPLWRDGDLGDGVSCQGLHLSKVLAGR